MRSYPTGARRRAPSILFALSLAAGAVAAQSAPPHERGGIPEGHGWFCFEDPLPTTGVTHACERPRSACEAHRARVRSHYEITGECLASPVAVCISFKRRGLPRHECTLTAAECSSVHAGMVDLARRVSYISELSECERRQ